MEKPRTNYYNKYKAINCLKQKRLIHYTPLDVITFTLGRTLIDPNTVLHVLTKDVFSVNLIQLTTINE